MAHYPTGQLANLIPDRTLSGRRKRQVLDCWLSLVKMVHKDYRNKHLLFHYKRATDTYSMPPDIASLILQIEP